MRAHMRHLVRRGLYCEIQPVFHRPDGRILFTRIMGEVAALFFLQSGHLRKSPVRNRTRHSFSTQSFWPVRKVLLTAYPYNSRTTLVSSRGIHVVAKASDKTPSRGCLGAWWPRRRSPLGGGLIAAAKVDSQAVETASSGYFWSQKRDIPSIT